MNIDLSQTEKKLLIEMLTMAGFIISSPTEEHVKKAESMHDLIQKIFENLKDNGFADSFENDDEAKMLFPTEDLINEGSDSILNLIREFNNDSTYEILGQQLAMRDLMLEKGFDSDDAEPAPEDIDDKFIEELYSKQEEYLKEFARNGFTNIQINKDK